MRQFRWRTLTLALAITTLVGLAIGLLLREREPKFAGKPLSHWTSLLVTIDQSSTEFIEASNAVVQLGERAWPFLLRDLAAKPYPWEQLPASLRARIPESLPLPVVMNRWLRGFNGLRVLGATASNAIPELDQMILQGRGETPALAQSALACIGTESVLPLLMRGLTNADPQRVCQAVNCLAEMGEHAAPAVPALVTNVAAADGQTRRLLAAALGQIRSQPELSVPTLAVLVRDADPRVQSMAVRALEEFDEAAGPALPALQAILSEPATSNPPHLATRHRAANLLVRLQCERWEGAIIRGPKAGRRLALVFTAHEYAEGAETILRELNRLQAKGSFFLTGDFLANTNFSGLISNLTHNWHYVGPHTDKHLLYCGWEASRPTLLTRAEFNHDLQANLRRLQTHFPASKIELPPVEVAAFAERYGLGVATSPQLPVNYFLPPYEHYNREIVRWTQENGLTLINFTPGTRSNADYTGEADKNFVSAQAIFDSILQREREDPHGLNGFILLFHLGSGPRRQDKVHHRFGELLDALTARGYQFVRVDELLEPPRESPPPAGPAAAPGP